MTKKVAKKKSTKSRKTGRGQAKSKAMRRATDERDITELMLEHHKPLKRLIKVMKKSDAEMRVLRAAFEEFAPLLEAHAKPEEIALYGYMKQEDEDEIRIEAYEGQTEHGIADMLAEEIKSLSDEQEWKAKVKVLAELVEHHIEEEESEMIPDLRKELELADRIAIGEQYLREREGFNAAAEAA